MESSCDENRSGLDQVWEAASEAEEKTDGRLLQLDTVQR